MVLHNRKLLNFAAHHSFDRMKAVYFLFAVLLVSCAASPVDNTMAHNDWPDRRTLFENFRQKDTAFIVYGKEELDLGEAISNALASMKKLDERFTVLMQRDDRLTEQQAANYPLYVVGTQKNLLLHRLDETIPIDFFENGFSFDGVKYTGPADIAKLSFYPNVFNPKLPLTIIVGNNEKALISFMQEQFSASWGYFFWDAWGYQVFHNSDRVIAGNFSEDSTKLWSIDKKVHYVFDYNGKKSTSDDIMTLYTHGEEPESDIKDEFIKSTESNILALEKFTGLKHEQPIEIHIYPTAENKTMMLDNADQSVIDFQRNQVHTVITQEYKELPDEAPVQLALRNSMGIPKSLILETGCAIRFTNNWQHLYYPYEGRQLAKAKLLPTISDMMNFEPFTDGTNLIMKISGALFTDFLIQTYGETAFRDNYLKYDAAQLLPLEQAWQDYALNKANAGNMQKESIHMENIFLKGFNFAHEGYQVYNGYMGTEAAISLEKLKSLGVNTVSLIPYSGFRSMTTPAPFEITDGAGAENDASIIHAAWLAHNNGMRVMLKPQLWSWLGWTGDIKMQNAHDWDLFFDYYQDWIMHYAMLAEAYDIEMFCIGVEFQDASLSEHNRWDELFDHVRTVYSGKITYAANWGAEFESVTFWDKLDYISVNCYYPLSNKKDATDAELLAGFEKNLDKIEAVQQQYKKPVLFTEIGFKSIEAPWIQPHMDDDDQAFNEISQQRCYKIMQEAMADEPWIAGVYLWKWPSFMDFSNDYKKDFTPCGKAAESTVKEWFSGK